MVAGRGAIGNCHIQITFCARVPENSTEAHFESACRNQIAPLMAHSCPNCRIQDRLLFKRVQLG